MATDRGSSRSALLEVNDSARSIRSARQVSGAAALIRHTIAVAFTLLACAAACLTYTATAVVSRFAFGARGLRNPLLLRFAALLAALVPLAAFSTRASCGPLSDLPQSAGRRGNNFSSAVIGSSLQAHLRPDKS